MKPTTTTQPPHDLQPFPFPKLEVYIQSRELAAGVHRASIGDAELRDQATRAAKSVFLNLGEAPPDSQLGVRRRHFCIARNSLCEVAAAVDLAVAIGALPAAVAGELVGRSGWRRCSRGTCGRRRLGAARAPSLPGCRKFVLDLLD